MKTPLILVVTVMMVLVGWFLLEQNSEINKNMSEKIGGEEIIKDNNQEGDMKGDVILKTSMGDIVIDLFEKETPKTVSNFLTLARNGFYDETRFHRVIDGFMVQGGDPLSKDLTKESLWGTGGPGYQFEDEIVLGLSNVVGTLSMANAGPNTNGSQFFINVGDNAFLDGKHTVFGNVLDGMDVVLAISKVGTEGRGTIDRPEVPILLKQVIVN